MDGQPRKQNRQEKFGFAGPEKSLNFTREPIPFRRHSAGTQYIQSIMQAMRRVVEGRAQLIILRGCRIDDTPQ